MYSLVYVSSASTLFTKQQLTELLQTARERNSAAQITGMLLYKDGNFMQVLEGEESAVKKLFNDISADQRHKGVMILLSGSVQSRTFPDWSMGFRDLRSPELAQLPGFNDFLNTSLAPEEFVSSPDRVRRLLLTFKSSM
ncbi:MAG: BLUF domain-containing protein [Pseudomonadota bacterium]|nr:BLUF domain-containing protein [Pseudomonadota bacterium]